MDPKRRDAIYFVPGFVRFLFWLKRPAQVRPEEIDTLKRWLNDISMEDISLETYRAGSTVKLLSGPLQGHYAAVSEQRGSTLELVLEELQIKLKVDLRQTEVIGI